MKHSKTFKKIGLCAALVPLSLFPETAKGQVTIVVSATVDMNFGTVTTNGGAGAITVDTLGARSVTGSLVAIGGAGLVSQGVFSISGSTGLAISVSMTNPTFTVNNGTGAVMNVNDFNMITNGGGTSATITLATSTETFT